MYYINRTFSVNLKIVISHYIQKKKKKRNHTNNKIKDETNAQQLI